jgi:hypothetical protein
MNKILVKVTFVSFFCLFVTANFSLRRSSKANTQQASVFLQHVVTTI